jgi:hypothetical protein
MMTFFFTLLQKAKLVSNVKQKRIIFVNKYFDDMRFSQIFGKIFVAYKIFPKIVSIYFVKVFVFAKSFSKIFARQGQTQTAE